MESFVVKISHYSTNLKEKAKKKYPDERGDDGIGTSYSRGVSNGYQKDEHRVGPGIMTFSQRLGSNQNPGSAEANQRAQFLTGLTKVGRRAPHSVITTEERNSRDSIRLSEEPGSWQEPWRKK